MTKDIYKKIVIWGTGIWGIQAFHYFEANSEIVAFIDSDENKIGRTFFGIEIKSPQFLKEYCGDVVVAIKGACNEIKQTLAEKYNIKYATFFQIECNTVKLECEKICDSYMGGNVAIVAFKGGLGNQMFQYAIYRAFENRGIKALADLSGNMMADSREFSLCKVFKNIEINSCSDSDIEQLVRKALDGSSRKKIVFYDEGNVYDTYNDACDLSFLDCSGGYFKGIFQSYKYADLVGNSLKDVFVFDFSKEPYLGEMCRKMATSNSIGVHIRGGDYLLPKYSGRFGGICTREYYQSALNYLRNILGEAEIYVFTNSYDIAEELFIDEEVNIIRKEYFNDYEDWYDMCMLSYCKNNIIANSSFSWWSAWINSYNEKIVIAPQRWHNGCKFEDICPPSWVRIDENGNISSTT